MDQHIALEIYGNILCHKLHRDVEFRPAGFGIEQNLFWLVAVASGLINGKNIPEQFGLFSCNLLEQNGISTRLFYYKISHFVWIN